MLVTFSSPVYANITMFGDVALRLIKLMGHSGSIPGALAAEDVAPALQRLEAAIEADKQSHAAEEESKGDEDGEPAVSLSLRAWPLIQLLKAAMKAESYVTWDSNK